MSPQATAAPDAAPATDSVLIEPVGRPRRSLPRRMLNWVGNLLLLLCLAVFLLVAVGPHVFGYRTATMLTGSMEPGIMPGDVVVTTPEPASDVKVGDVISYHIPIEDRRVETHRVVKVIHRDNGNDRDPHPGRQQRERRPVDGDARGRHRLGGPDRCAEARHR